MNKLLLCGKIYKGKYHYRPPCLFLKDGEKMTPEKAYHCKYMVKKRKEEQDRRLAWEKEIREAWENRSNGFINKYRDENGNIIYNPLPCANLKDPKYLTKDMCCNQCKRFHCKTRRYILGIIM